MGDYDDTDCISTVTVLNATWTNCPKEVKDQIRQLWADHEYGNDSEYHTWYWDGVEESLSQKQIGVDDYEDCFKYPIIRDYLISRGLKDVDVKIHYWW